MTLDCKDLLAKLNNLHLFASTDPPFSGLDPPLFSNPALRIFAGLVLLAIRIQLYQCFTAKLALDYRMLYLENSVPLSWIPPVLALVRYSIQAWLFDLPEFAPTKRKTS